MGAFYENQKPVGCISDKDIQAAYRDTNYGDWIRYRWDGETRKGKVVGKFSHFVLLELPSGMPDTLTWVEVVQLRNALAELEGQML